MILIRRNIEDAPFKIGSSGVRFLETDDIVLYLAKGDTHIHTEHCPGTSFAEARYLGRSGSNCVLALMTPYESYTGSEGGRKTPIKHEEGKRIEVSPDEIWWDSARPFPADRIRRCLYSNTPTPP